MRIKEALEKHGGADKLGKTLLVGLTSFSAVRRTINR